MRCKLGCALTLATLLTACGDGAPPPAEQAAPQPPAAPIATPAQATLGTIDGKEIYAKKCAACHGAGIAGAPKLGSKDDWAARIAQGTALLNEHAIKGYKGSTGFMPPKGGAASLSDDEVAAAVGFMIEQVR